MNVMRKATFVAWLALFATFVAVSPPNARSQPAPEAAHGPQSTILVEEGRRLVQLNCSSCHAIGRSGDSPNAMAPPFRRLSQNYPIEALDEAFAEGVFVGHSNMPQFNFTPGEIDALTAYVESIQDAPAHRDPQ